MSARLLKSTLLMAALVCMPIAADAAAQPAPKPSAARTSAKPTGASGREWYRYTNENGVVVLDQSIPPRYIDNGYTVLAGDGRVLRVIPSKAERERLEIERLKNEERNKVLAEQEANDQDLMRMYSSPDDVERARDRRLASIDVAISLALNGLERARREKAALEGEGAKLERSGMPVPKKMVDNLAALETKIRQASAEIQTRRNEKERVRAAYQRDIQRVKELYGYTNPDQAH